MSLALAPGGLIGMVASGGNAVCDEESVIEKHGWRTRWIASPLWTPTLCLSTIQVTQCDGYEGSRFARSLV